MNTAAPGPESLPDPLPYPWTDNQRLVQMIAEVLEKPVDEVRETVYEAERSPTEFFQREFAKLGIPPYTWCDELEEFYRNTDIYLFGGVVWNRKPYKIELREWISSYLINNRSRRQRLLSVGDGVGCDSLYLSQCGHDVTYSELSEKCIRFARNLFELAGESIKVVEDVNDIEQSAYDVVLCLDVLEHVPEPRDLVEQFSRYVRPGGILIVHAPFYYVSLDNPTHLASNRRYSGDLRNLYGRYGFSLEDGRLFWDPLVFVKQSPDAPSAKGRRLRKLVLRATGMLLAVGRVWCTPHNLVASSMAGNGDPKWLVGLKKKQ